MNNTTKKRKIQMMEYPVIKINTIKKYDNFQNNSIIVAPNREHEIIRKKVRKNIKKKKNIAGINGMKVISTVFYTTILLIATMTKMWMTYEVSNLGEKKAGVDKKINEIKLEVETLENTYISKFDLKQVEKKSKELGFIHNDTIEYVKLNK